MGTISLPNFLIRKNPNFSAAFRAGHPQSRVLNTIGPGKKSVGHSPPPGGWRGDIKQLSAHDEQTDRMANRSLCGQQVGKVEVAQCPVGHRVSPLKLIKFSYQTLSCFY